MMRKVGRTDTIEVVATFVVDDNKELVTTDIFAFHNNELVTATLTVCCEEINAVATNIAAPKNNCKESKLIAETKEYNMEQQIADDTITTAGIHGQHTKSGAGTVDDRVGLHGQHRDEDHHRAAFIKEDQEPRIGTFLKITPKTMYETNKKSVLNMTGAPSTEALAHYNNYNNEFTDTNLADNDKGFAAALTANGIKFAITTCAADTLDEELVAAATFATYKEKFIAITALNDYVEEFATIFALATYDEEFDDTPQPTIK